MLLLGAWLFPLLYVLEGIVHVCRWVVFAAFFWPVEVWEPIGLFSFQTSLSLSVQMGKVPIKEMCLSYISNYDAFQETKPHPQISSDMLPYTLGCESVCHEKNHLRFLGAFCQTVTSKYYILNFLRSKQRIFQENPWLDIESEATFSRYYWIWSWFCVHILLWGSCVSWKSLEWEPVLFSNLAR